MTGQGNSIRATGYLPPEFLTLQEFPEKARANLPDTSWDYLAGGAETETTYLRNRMSLDSLAFRPRVCRDVSKVDVRGRFMGRDLRLPVFLAPIASSGILPRERRVNLSASGRKAVRRRDRVSKFKVKTARQSAS